MINQIETIVQLEKWLKNNCYSMDSYSINGNHIYEGFGLNVSDNKTFQWYYIERGHKEILETFINESDAVQFAFKKITNDIHAKRNYIGMYKKKEAEKVLLDLQKREVEYYIDKIPYNGINDIIIRVFVIGCGIKKVADLIKNAR